MASAIEQLYAAFPTIQDGAAPAIKADPDFPLEELLDWCEEEETGADVVEVLNTVHQVDFSHGFVEQFPYEASGVTKMKLYSTLPKRVLSVFHYYHRV